MVVRPIKRHQISLRFEKFSASIVLNAFLIFTLFRLHFTGFFDFFLPLEQQPTSVTHRDWLSLLQNMFSKTEQRSTSYSEEVYGSETTEKTIPFLR